MTHTLTEPTTIYQRPAELLQNLIRFDTTNPPGNEAACVAYLDGLLKSLGIETTLIEKEPGRPNLIARIKGSGDAPPLLLQGHVDVVTTANQDWEHPPFDGEVIDGFMWGRGTLDMKGGVTMMASAFMRAAAENTALPGDVILCILSDEEVGGDAGAKFLVEAHPYLFEGVRYAIGEFGGFTMMLGGKRFYPIMVAEKQVAWTKLHLYGPAGHASRPMRGGTMAKLAQVLHTLDQNQLPVHITPPARMMIEGIASGLPEPMNQMLLLLLNPEMTDTLLEQLGEQGALFSAMLHNTVSPTIIHASDKINVHPAKITLELDGRILPGQTMDDLFRELHDLLGNDIALETVQYDPGANHVDMGLFDMLADILKEQDPDAVPIPMLLNAVTDGRFFSLLGIQTYGFTPMLLPEDFTFTSVIHAANERIPVEAVAFGTDAIFKALQRFGR